MSNLCTIPGYMRTIAHWISANLMGLHFGECSEVQADVDDSSPESDSSAKRDSDIADLSADSSMDDIDQLGELGELLYPDSPDDPTLPDFLLPTSQVLSLPVSSFQPTSPSTPPPDDADESMPTRAWTGDDREDLHKLGNMVSSFLEVPQFAGETNSKVFGTHVIVPLMDASGPRPGSIKVLKQLMEGIMIRHR